MILSTQQGRGEREPDDIAPSPFDNPRGDADVVLSASDGVAFFLHTSTLRMSSTFFANILPFPSAPESAVGIARTAHGLPIIPVTETSRILNYLLRAVYPADIPTITTLEDAALLLRGACKYQMPLVASVVQNSLKALCHAGHGLDVYALACTFHLEQMAEYAAGIFCAVGPSAAGAEAARPIHCIDEYTPAMDTIPAASYFRFFCSPTPHATASSPGTCNRHTGPSRTKKGSGKAPPPFNRESAIADVIIRSTDGVEFYVNSLVVGIASPVMARKLQKQPSSSDSETGWHDAGGTHLINLPEDSATLTTLLSLCYPMPDPEIKWSLDDGKLSRACRLMEAATKYDVQRAQAFAKRACVQSLDSQPQRVFFIATKFGWHDVVESAAMHAVYERGEDYVPEMETVPAAVYRRLLVYRQQCRDITLPYYTPVFFGRDGGKQDPKSGAPYWDLDGMLDLETWGEQKFWRAFHQLACKKDGVLDFPTMQEIVPYTLLTDHTSGGDPASTTTGPAYLHPTLQQIVQLGKLLARVSIVQSL
ncbi:uncharacterized protein B0H18DRAFT_880079 [Fomitopsis serialis]|uniref:uncharacterized protein n=1 Tax=Fomitopsis serialis TaxID=139415 RepID=UPI002007BC4E|nr:uncharacterized protein B0H18DRAFT_880079 [Neoantrodia serialis]KAH9921626.1 hypothetical protein B0H18DRAFT_880079 [Neoantrodia serialis]